MVFKNTEIEDIMNLYGTKGIPFLFIIDFEGRKAEVFTDEECVKAGILFQTIQHRNYQEKIQGQTSFLFDKKPIDFSLYQKAFQKVKEEINYGNSYLVNLTFPTALSTNLNLESVFYRSTAKFKLLYPGKFVVFSPEIFVLIKNKIISAFPMKGTIDAGLDNAREIVLKDPKEKAEHNTIVDLIRNDLSMVSENVRVEKFRYIDKIDTNQKSLLQVSSHIAGDLPAEYLKKTGSIISRLLPAGSVSGAPKAKTVSIIKEAELDERGYYTGIFGYFDGKNLESGVMIRFIEQTSEGLLFRSGGGITSLSNCESEYNEMIDKVYVPFV
ncbi:MAG: aminodeoxychorismate synthase component I [Bacteroidales bacterium]